MKKIKSYLFLSLATIPIVGVAGLKTLSSSDELVQKIAPSVATEVIVHDYDEFEAAIEDTSKTEKSIVFANDIDLSEFTPEDSAQLPYNDYSLEIDGNGFSFYNKPSEYFFYPIISGANALGSELTSSRLYVHNLTFDNAGYLFTNDNAYSTTDFTSSNPISTSNSVYFQDITIENITLDSQELDAPSKLFNNYGLLFGNINIVKSGKNPDVPLTIADNALTLSDIKIQNNTITNNTFNFSTPIASLSFSPLGNLTCDNKGTGYVYTYSSFVNINDISISGNKFIDNTLISSNLNDIMFSYGNVFGSYIGVSNWAYSQKNYIDVSNIFIQNNIVSNLNGISYENFTYSELISNPTSTYNQYTTVNSLQNIYSINNIILSDYSSRKLYYQEDISLINMKIDVRDSGGYTNSINEEVINSITLIGPNYYDSTNLIEIFPEYPEIATNEVYHSKVLSTSKQEFVDLNNSFLNTYGIYGYDLTTRTGEQLNNMYGEYGVNLDPDQRYLTKINLASNEDAAIIYDSSVVKDGDSIYSINLRFKYLQADALINDPISSAYTLNELVLSSQGVNLGTAIETEATTTFDNNFVYSINFEWEDGISTSKFDVNDLYLSFSYQDNVRNKHNVSVQLNLEDTKFLTHPNITEDTTTIIAAVVGGIIGLIILIALVLLGIWYYRKRQVAKVDNVQDGYLEYKNSNDIPYEYQPSSDQVYQEPAYDYQSYQEQVYDDYISASSTEIDYY